MDQLSVIHINEKDNVAVASTALKAGDDLAVAGAAVIRGGHAVKAAEDIPAGHKVALYDIKKDEPVIKYGVAVAKATEDIEAGRWVHTHNAVTGLDGEGRYEYHPVHVEPLTDRPGTFSGYLRKDGRAGIRNEIWVIPAVGCVGDTARYIAAESQDLVKGAVEGIYAYEHPFGCSQTGEDHARTRKVLAALASHPNAGGALIVSLGCENCTMEQLQEELGEYDHERIRFLRCQDAGDELAEGRRILHELAEIMSADSRTDISTDKLIAGLKCGGSDGLSGITANPTVGAFSDLLIARGGSTILTEVPEMFGAEEMLLPRCRDKEVYERAAAMLTGFRKYFIENGENVYENPSPGNRDGGITTLEDKSCGCVQKGGSAEISDVIGYGESVRRKGLTLLYGPGNDLVSTTALTAAGAQIILFTTGRGTPFGAPVPTVKISTNTDLYDRKRGWIDFDAGGIVRGDSFKETGERLYDEVISIASGKKTRNEINGYRQIAFFKGGVVL